MLAARAEPWIPTKAEIVTVWTSRDLTYGTGVDAAAKDAKRKRSEAADASDGVYESLDVGFGLFMLALTVGAEHFVTYVKTSVLNAKAMPADRPKQSFDGHHTKDGTGFIAKVTARRTVSVKTDSGAPNGRTGTYLTPRQYIPSTQRNYCM